MLPACCDGQRQHTGVELGLVAGGQLGSWATLDQAVRGLEQAAQVVGQCFDFHLWWHL